jgi:hypothetical protein
MFVRISLGALLLSALYSPLLAQEKSRDELVLEDRANLKGNAEWIYDDFETAKERAQASGKPMMIVLRCIP